MLSSTSVLVLALALPAIIQGTQYGLVKEYAGTHFFDDWDFYGHCEIRSFAGDRFSLPLMHHPALRQMITSPTASPSMFVALNEFRLFFFYALQFPDCVASCAAAA